MVSVTVDMVDGEQLGVVYVAARTVAATPVSDNGLSLQ
jgi:hypothetical protein